MSTEQMLIAGAVVLALIGFLKIAIQEDRRREDADRTRREIRDELRRRGPR